jgi:hypothetical protein
MNFKKLFLLLAIVCLPNSLFSQSDSIEVYLIDAYCTREVPYTFKLSFYTSDVCKSKVIIENEYEYDISTEPVDLHKINIDLTGLNFKQQVVYFVILTEDSLGNKSTSETFDFDFPFEPQIKEGSDLFTLCLFGSAIFLLPYPNYVSDGHTGYFSLTKEIPVLSFRSRSLNYPAGYVSLEYTYIFDAEDQNYLRLEYKKIFEMPHIEYIAPGISLYSNFNVNHGVSPEVSVGLFTIEDTFTFYARYRYNIKLYDQGTNFHEASIGLYSGFFSLYLD